eukprot:1092261_1
MDAQRALLDQLMGVDRNLTEDETPTRKLRWDDEEVCQYYIAGFCPNELFLNTKSDLGPCELQHDLALRQVYEAESPSIKRGVRSRFERFLQSMVDDLDRKIELGRRRIDLANENDPNNPENEKRIDNLNSRIDETLDKIEKLGEKGDIDEAKELMDEVNNMKEEKAKLMVQQPVNLMLNGRLDPNSDKRMVVCDICGAFLVQNEAESRVKDHLNGKQHTGFAKIRDAIKAMERARGGKRQDTRESLERARGPFERARARTVDSS